MKHKNNVKNTGQFFNAPLICKEKMLYLNEVTFVKDVNPCLRIFMPCIGQFF